MKPPVTNFCLPLLAVTVITQKHCELDYQVRGSNILLLQPVTKTKAYTIILLQLSWPLKKTALIKTYFRLTSAGKFPGTTVNVRNGKTIISGWSASAKTFLKVVCLLIMASVEHWMPAIVFQSPLCWYGDMWHNQMKTFQVKGRK